MLFIYLYINSVYLIKLNQRSIKTSIFIIKKHIVINNVYMYTLRLFLPSKLNKKG